MAPTDSPFQETSGDETATAPATNLTWPVGIGVNVIKLQHVILAPLVILSIPAQSLYQQNIPLTVVVALTGLTGMLLGRRSIVIAASLALLAVLLWGKMSSKTLGIAPPDTALLLGEFMTVLILMEGSFAVLSFNRSIRKLEGMEDEFATILRARLQTWLRNQLVSQARLGLVALGLSIVLLPVAGLTSIGSNQLVFSATLALLAVVLLLFLVTHRREPKAPEASNTFASVNASLKEVNTILQ